MRKFTGNKPAWRDQYKFRTGLWISTLILGLLTRQCDLSDTDLDVSEPGRVGDNG